MRSTAVRAGTMSHTVRSTDVRAGTMSHTVRSTDVRAGTMVVQTLGTVKTLQSTGTAHI